MAEPRLLILETSGRIGQVALAEGPVLRGVRRLDEARRHARDLAPSVVELLAAAQWQPRDLNGVVVSRGPGSYTGLRVALMSARAFAYATGCALLAVDTFTALAEQAPATATVLDVLADAQQEKIYVQRFVRPSAEAGWLPGSPLTIRPLGEWLADLPAPVLVTGPGLHRYRQRLPERVAVVDPDHWDPHPESLLRLGLRRYQAGERDDVWALEPLYLRPSSAEEQWRKAPAP
jgi:tRNA threonylcarbamoyladenosine biosynthesis protein TsaB